MKMTSSERELRKEITFYFPDAGDRKSWNYRITAMRNALIEECAKVVDEYECYGTDPMRRISADIRSLKGKR